MVRLRGHAILVENAQIAIVHKGESEPVGEQRVIGVRSDIQIILIGIFWPGEGKLSGKVQIGHAVSGKQEVRQRASLRAGQESRHEYI